MREEENEAKGSQSRKKSMIDTFSRRIQLRACRVNSELPCHGICGNFNKWRHHAATVPVEAQSGVTSISSGNYYSSAVAGGKVVSLGDYAQVIPSDALSGVSAVAQAHNHALALKAGQVIVWGENGWSPLNLPMAALSQVTAIAAGGMVSIATGTVTTVSATPSVTLSATATKKPVMPKKTTITCVKGKLVKRVTATKPKCPTGWKKK